MGNLFKIKILGCAAAAPTSTRFTSSQIINYHNRYFLFDCAEGTQIQLRRYKIPMMKINNIFITHLHGDHYLGLLGLLSSFQLHGRLKDLHVFALADLEKLLKLHFEISDVRLQYKIIFHALKMDMPEEIYSDPYLSIETIIMKHSMPTCGFVIKEKKAPLKIKAELIEKYQIPVLQVKKIKQGADFITTEGKHIANHELTIAPPPPRTYAFCSDTGYTESFLPQIMDADLIYHEATFMQEMQKLAEEKTHSTTIEAATIAIKARAKKLLIGHYSARYDDLKPYLEEAQNVFTNTILAEEGLEISL